MASTQPYELTRPCDPMGRPLLSGGYASLHGYQAEEEPGFVAVDGVYESDDLSRERKMTQRVWPREDSAMVVVSLLSLLVQLEESLGDRGRLGVYRCHPARSQQRSDVGRAAAADRAVELADPRGDGPDVPVGDPASDAVAKVVVRGCEHLSCCAITDRVEHGVVRGRHPAAMRRVRRTSTARLVGTRRVATVRSLSGSIG